MTSQGDRPSQRTFTESEMEAMKDRELMDFIRETVGTLNRLGDRLEAFARTPQQPHDRGAGGAHTS